MEHSRRWWLHIWGSKMFELLIHAGMSVFELFFADYTCHWNKWEFEDKSWFTEVENIPKKRSFLKTFLKGPASNQEFLKCATWFELAHFGNSQFVVAHFRNSWFELAHFGISWIVVAHFRNSWFEAGPFKKLFSKLRFFGMFFTSMNQFLASNSHLFRWHVYSAKKLVKNAHSCVK